MNRTISFITKMMFAAVTVIMAACSSDDNATQALTVQVKVSMPEGFKSDILYTGHTVTMGKYTAITNEKGIATFEGVIPDLYDISTSCEITAEEYEDYIDAGYQYTEATTGYTGEVVYRKTAKTENGRTILADTNNSSNDFAVSAEIKPREYK